jgi:uncharacterized protein
MNHCPPVVDAHLHADFEAEDSYSGLPATREDLARELARACVVGAVVHRQDGQPWTDPLPGLKVVQCYGVGERVDAAELEEGLRSGTFGCIKLYLGYIWRYADDPAHEPVFALAERYDVPVVLHTGDTSEVGAKLRYADPLTVDTVAVDHPNVTFVVAHLGNPWIASAAEVAYKNPNVYLDGSALFAGSLAGRRRELRKYAVDPIAWAFGYIEDPTKILFGSDWSIASITATEWVFKRAIPRRHWRAVFHDNAVAVFHLAD